MREIQLTKGKVALVDDADFEQLSQWTWCAYMGSSGVWYARRTDSTRKTIRMHRHLLGITSPSVEVDHKNGDGLDNQRDNLRACPHIKNMGNSRVKAGKYKGVSWHRGTSQWQAQIGVNMGKIPLGYYRRSMDAAVAYDEAAQIHFGEFARLNFSYDSACYI